MIKRKVISKRTSFFHPKTNESWTKIEKTKIIFLLFNFIPIWINECDYNFEYSFDNKNGLGFNK